MGRLIVGSIVAGALAIAGCVADPVEPVGPHTADPWADIDTHYPSEDPVATVYGYVQSMAEGDDEAACAFQYRGSSDFDPRPCLLVTEMPHRDRGFSGADWERLADFSLRDYVASEDAGGWKVTIPQGPGVAWRIQQDDAGIWYIS